MTQPTDAVVGSVIAPAITIELRDSNNALLPTSDVPITIMLGDNPANGLLGGTFTVNTLNGIATFSDLSLDTAGTGKVACGPHSRKPLCNNRRLRPHSLP